MHNFLLINPPVYDFAAYDLWSKPLGLLYISAMLKKSGMAVNLIDCMDKKPVAINTGRKNKYGCGPYFSKAIPKPETLRHIPRKYHRFGMPAEEFRGLLSFAPAPDVILITSIMTYWYPGVFEAVREVKSIFPKVPVILGGVYASICKDHAAAFSGADHIVSGCSLKPLENLLSSMGIKVRLPAVFNDFPSPDVSYYKDPGYAALRTSCGCPYRCSYCAINQTGPRGFERKDRSLIISEIESLYENGIKNIAFYDDALLYEPQSHLIPILESICSKKLKLNLHTPNGLHTRFINPELASAMKKAGFIMPRLSFETSNDKRQLASGGKVYRTEFKEACSCLLKAGYAKKEFGAYVLMGMPGQDFEEVRDSMEFAHSCGAKVFLVEYSPIPGTKDWDKIKDCLPSADPLWHNNSIFPLFPLSSWPKFQELKTLARKLNS